MDLFLCCDRPGLADSSFHDLPSSLTDSLVTVASVPGLCLLSPVGQDCRCRHVPNRYLVMPRSDEFSTKSNKAEFSDLYANHRPFSQCFSLCQLQNSPGTGSSERQRCDSKQAGSIPFPPTPHSLLTTLSP